MTPFVFGTFAGVVISIILIWKFWWLCSDVRIIRRCLEEERSEKYPAEG